MNNLVSLLAAIVLWQGVVQSSFQTYEFRVVKNSNGVLAERHEGQDALGNERWLPANETEAPVCYQKTIEKLTK